MKFAVLALVAFAGVAQAADRACDTLGLIKIVGGTNGLKCANDSGYSATTGKLPTDAQFNVLCFNDACAAYREELKAKEPTECVINGVFPQPTPLYATLITPIEDECKKRRTPAPTTPGPTPTVTPEPTKPNQTTPAPTKPDQTTPAPTKPDQTTPAPTKPNPKPAC